jgi:hypothetical protein
MPVGIKAFSRCITEPKNAELLAKITEDRLTCALQSPAQSRQLSERETGEYSCNLYTEPGALEGGVRHAFDALSDILTLLLLHADLL